MKGLLTKAAVAAVGTLLLGGFTFAAVGNDHTGFDSDNNANIDQTNTAAIVADNEADLENIVNGTLTSGANFSDYNTGNGSAKSGDASADISAENEANEAIVSLAIDGMFMDNPSVTNSVTGAQSTNNAWITSVNTLTVTTTNDANVDNEATVSADTGGNDASYNTGSGSVESGDASLEVSFSNKVNSSNVSTH